MKLTFLSAAVPLTKTITLKDGVISKQSYPLQNKFTSTTTKIKTLSELYKTLKTNSQHPDKPCLLKGEIQKQLENESRKYSTRTNTPTSMVVFDMDRAPFNSPDEFMHAIGIDDISYVVQYSASYKINKKDKTLSCHIFCLLSSPRPAPELKAWLMHLNLSTDVLRNALTLSNSTHALHWSLDITCCQNDKLIYIAEPTFVGMKSPIPPDERIQFVKRTIDTLPVERIALRPMDTLKKAQRTLLNELQTAAGITPNKSKTKMVGEYEVQPGVGEIAQYQVTDCGEYNRLNLNGGDSNAYYHRKDDPILLHNFKGEPSVYIKEILPQYYADLLRARSALEATPNASGDILLAYRDKVTAAYHKGTWNEGTQNLELYTVKSRDQLADFLLSHGRALGDFVPEWSTTFDPQNPIIFDEVNHTINLFAPTNFMRQKKAPYQNFPAIQRIINSAVGTKEIQTHFLNWLAFMFQTRKKPLTSWILHGTFGTGKGMLVNKIIAPLFGPKYVHQMRASELNEKYNSWLETSLIVFVDEIEADMFTNPKGAESDLRNYITEPNITIRRMRTDPYMVSNYTGFIFSSNKRQPVHIPIGDRRFNVGAYQRERFYPTDEELLALPKELKAFANFLLNYKVCEKTAHSILQTDERQAIQQLSVTSVDQIANDILNGNLRGLIDALPDAKLMAEMGVQNPTAAAYISIIKRFAEDLNNGTSPSRITRDELAVIFTHCVGKVPEGTHKFTAYLRHHGIATKKMRIDDDTPRGIETVWEINAKDRMLLANLFPTKLQKLKFVK